MDMLRKNREKVLWRTLAFLLLLYFVLAYTGDRLLSDSEQIRSSIVQSLTLNVSTIPTYKVYIDKLPWWRSENSVKLHYSSMPFINRHVLKIPERRLYIVFEAQLGNNLFQLASVIGLSILTGRKPYFVVRNDKWHQTASQLLNISALIPVIPALPTQKVTFIKEVAPMTWDSKLAGIISRMPSDVVVCCYLQSWRYFIHDAENIRVKILANMFPKNIQKADKDIRRYAAKVYPNLSPNAPTWAGITIIGIQVRRGDKIKARGYNVAPKSYFDHGMEFYRRKYNKTLFIIVSQDHEWSKANIQGADVVHTDPGGSAAEDMTLLSRCNHTLGSVGSYTWWAGWLAGGTTVYYKNHTYGMVDRPALSTESDYWPPHFVPLL